MSIYVNVPDAIMAAVAVAGTVLGYLAGRRKNKGPMCGCGHSISFHKNGTGGCKKLVGFDRDQCDCQIYFGPKIIDVFDAQKYLPPDK